MKLYYTPGACSLSVHIAALEAGMNPELVKVDLMTHKLASGEDFYAINPRGYVPVLELDDGGRHTEASSLLQYIGDKAPSARLLPPAGTPERLEVMGWVGFIASEMHKIFSPWLWHKETAESTQQACRDKVARAFAELDAHLARRSFLAGDRFTIADAYCFNIANWANFLGIGLAAYPSLSAYMGRIAARPAVRAALVAEGLAKA